MICRGFRLHSFHVLDILQPLQLFYAYADCPRVEYNALKVQALLRVSLILPFERADDCRSPSKRRLIRCENRQLPVRNIDVRPEIKGE